MFRKLIGRGPVSVVLSVLLSMFFVAAVVQAATTISTNISTGGTLGVSGLASLSGQASTTQLSAGTAYFGTTATSTFSTAGALTLVGALSGTSGTFSTTLGVTGLSSLGKASSTMLSAGSAYFGTTATSSFTSAGVLTLQNGETISNATDYLINITAASTTLSGTLALTGGVVTSSGLASIGTIEPAATVDVSANTGRVAGLQLNLVSSGATVTGFRGIDSRVADTGTAANVVGVQGVATHSAGVSTAELWGGNLLAHHTGGTMVNSYGAVGSVDVQNAATVGADSGNPNFIAGVLATSFVGPTATLSNDIVDAPLIAQVENGGGRKKATAAAVALLQGDSGTNTAGAAFKAIDHNSTAGYDFDYGLDFGAGPGGPIGGQTSNGANTFLQADIRLAKGDTIKNTAASTTVLSSDLTIGGGTTGASGDLVITNNGNAAGTIATSTLSVGCVQVTATSSATKIKMVFNAVSTTTDAGHDAGTATAAGYVLWAYGTCP